MRWRPKRIAAGAIDRDIRLHIPEFERIAGTAACKRVPDRSPTDVNDQVAIVLEDEFAIAVLASVAGRVAVPHGVRSGGVTVGEVDDEVAVGLEEEAYTVVEAGEG